MDLIDGYSEENADNQGYAKYYGQSFTVNSNYTITKAGFYIFSQSPPAGNVRAYIYNLSGTYGTNSVPTGSPIATSDAIDIANIPSYIDNVDWVDFSFTGGNLMNFPPGHYFSVVSFDGGASNYLGKRVDSTSPTHSGNRAVSTDGSSWGGGADADLIFRVYGYSTPPTIQGISSLTGVSSITF